MGRQCLHSFIPSFIKHRFKSPMVTDPVLGTGSPIMNEIGKCLHSSLTGRPMWTKLATLWCFKVMYKGAVNKGPRAGTKQDILRREHLNWALKDD